jgi:thiosulfate dehydrogenase [quinone] large subunit
MITDYSPKQLFGLVFLRIVIGWHFLYEGLIKLTNPAWSAATYLQESQWIFAAIFRWIAGHNAVLALVDWLNIWGLILIGCGLLAGCFAKTATLSGVVLLALYYLCHPPLIGYVYAVPEAGAALIVNRVLIEMSALLVLFFFPTGHLVGLDRIIGIRKHKK